MAKGAAVMTLDRVPEVLAAIRMLTTEAVFVGIPAPEAPRGAGEPIDNAALGYIHNNGSAARNIPARPTLVPGIEKVQAQIADELSAGANAVLGGRPDAVRTSYNRAGLIAVASVKRVITSSEGLAPLAEATLEARRNRKRAPRKGTKPLIDTGQYLNSHTYVIRKK